ncbi:MAG: DUF1365 family protein, partial [Alphaproteobacteria bacterium]|nr:DUF1365 family protein [Alphaproteobacteria bacterium]
NGVQGAAFNVVLVTMPRVLGYVFNPVSFWLCYDEMGQLRAVLCEVNNTFGEHHDYLCVRPDKGPIGDTDTLVGSKQFHVSPFMEREGSYTFRFTCRDDALGFWIDHYDAEGKKLLVTSLVGKLHGFDDATLWRMFWRYPLVPLVAIIRIHWQALRLISKGIGYIRKPPQKAERQSVADNITKF